MLRTHTCGQLDKSEVGAEVELCGWVHSWRNHGGIIFIDLRDRYGITQVTFDPRFCGAELMAEADKLRDEWVIKVRGNVAARPDNMVNQKLATGTIEIEASELSILNRSVTPPFVLEEEKAHESKEQIRLKYRYVDLRRKHLQDLIALKADYIHFMREYMRGRGFIEIQTPILANSSPEGARDFLVPSRLHNGMFYALPQAPQQFKQLLMVGGFDRYFQIAPCFRDEDPRMDRAYGEFYQLDFEMSFAEQEDVLQVVEPLFKELTKRFSNKEIMNLNEDGTFRRLPWREAMTRYGSDKPDLRFDLEIMPITEMVAGCGFSVFADMAAKKGNVVHAMKVDKAAQFSRKDIDELTEIARAKGAKGLAYIIVRDNELQSPIVKFLGEELARRIVDHVGAKVGDTVFFGADEYVTVCKALGAVRNECAQRLGLKDDSKAAFCWVVDFPMYSESEIEPGRIDFEHNPFSMPQGGLKALEEIDPINIVAYQYDCVLNGFEVTSGAIRNHDPEIMYKAFDIAGYTREEVDARFGAMITAFKHGAPPHGGAAPGIDRLLMVLQDVASIRDIYAFPKDGSGRDVMMDSPSAVDEKQLRELHIKLRKEVK